MLNGSCICGLRSVSLGNAGGYLGLPMIDQQDSDKQETDSEPWGIVCCFPASSPFGIQKPTCLGCRSYLFAF